MHYADGWRFLADAADRGDRYDVVIVDLPDEPVEVDDPAQHARLYGTPFLRRCSEVLAPGGVVCTQAGCPTLWRNDTLARMADRFDDVFPAVLPYCSDEHEWALRAKAGDENYSDFYLIFPDREMPDQYEAHLREIFPDEHPGAFTWFADIRKWVWTTFHSYQWDLNYANPAVFNRMAEHILD